MKLSLQNRVFWGMKRAIPGQLSKDEHQGS